MVPCTAQGSSFGRTGQYLSHLCRPKGGLGPLLPGDLGRIAFVRPRLCVRRSVRIQSRLPVGRGKFPMPRDLQPELHLVSAGTLPRSGRSYRRTNNRFRTSAFGRRQTRISPARDFDRRFGIGGLRDVCLEDRDPQILPAKRDLQPIAGRRYRARILPFVCNA